MFHGDLFLINAVHDVRKQSDDVQINLIPLIKEVSSKTFNVMASTLTGCQIGT